MPPLILWALGAVGAAMSGRWLYKESQRINAELHPEQPPASESEMRASSSATRRPVSTGRSEALSAREAGPPSAQNARAG